MCRTATILAAQHSSYSGSRCKGESGDRWRKPDLHNADDPYTAKRRAVRMIGSAPMVKALPARSIRGIRR